MSGTSAQDRARRRPTLQEPIGRHRRYHTAAWEARAASWMVLENSLTVRKSIPTVASCHKQRTIKDPGVKDKTLALTKENIGENTFVTPKCKKVIKHYSKNKHHKAHNIRLTTVTKRFQPHQSGMVSTG